MRLTFVFAVLAGLWLPMIAAAQGTFSPVITVNDKAITGYELDQRIRLLTLFRTPGNLLEVAREQLIDDRLKQQTLEGVGASLVGDALETEMESFTARANLELDQFLTVLQQNGIERATLEEFVQTGVLWRDYVRRRFDSRAQITDAEVDRAIGQLGGGTQGIEVLLSEIIIPAPPPEAAQALAQAEQIARLTSTSAFSAQAREVSALPSRNNGGRLGWLPISNYPPQLRPVLLALDLGEVTAPIQIPNGIALFQMRGIREVAAGASAPTAIEYAAYYVASPQEAQAVAERVDTCDDLYGEAKGQPAEVLERDTLPIADIPQDVVLELARLDAGEVSTTLTRSEGQTSVVLMLCNRQFGESEPADRDQIRSQLRSRRLSGLADGLIADLRAAATING
ncbi:peptidylprolyl isomerase [Cognatiyoonia sp.]|uniref:peptidylprolyl isomerase n=1 Tax=Cognatiyoonia sp. TaxID=2211652 RepID=UPI003F69D8AD